MPRSFNVSRISGLWHIAKDSSIICSEKGNNLQFPGSQGSWRSTPSYRKLHIYSKFSEHLFVRARERWKYESKTSNFLSANLQIEIYREAKFISLSHFETYLLRFLYACRKREREISKNICRWLNCLILYFVLYNC